MVKKNTDPNADSGKESLEAYLNSEEFGKTLSDRVEETVNTRFDETFNRALTRQLKPALVKVQTELANTLATKMSEIEATLKANAGADDSEGDDKDKNKGAGKKSPQDNAEITSLRKTVEQLQKDVTAERTERQKVEEQALHDRKIAKLTTAAQKHNARDPEVVVRAVRDDVFFDEESKGFVAKRKNDAGAEEIVPADEHVKEYLEQRDFLVQANDKDGSGQRRGDGAGGGGGKGELSEKDFTSQETYDAAVKAGKIHGVVSE